MTLQALEAAVRASWGPDVCEKPADLPRRSPANPVRGQCGPTALVVHDLLGGDIDLTLEQFGAEELVQMPRVLSRPAGPLRRGEPEYLLLRSRVLARLAGDRPTGADTVAGMALLAGASA